MSAVYFSIVLIIVVTCGIVYSGKASRPNIVLIIADDLGWNDVSFHGSNQILTPNIDLLAYSGVNLGRYYSHSMCTPSRSALLTGKFAYTLGMHGYPLTNGEDRGIPVAEKLLPQYLKEVGYSTHLVGKWHVGQSRTAYLPTSRGFDTFFGHKGGVIDYYEYTNEETWTSGPVSGMDLTRNLSAAWDVEGYITDVYNDEAKKIIKEHDESKPLFLMLAHNAPHSSGDGIRLQAPPDEVRAMRHVESPNRRVYAAMVKKLDDSVGDIMSTLHEKDMLDNTVVVFMADNGGMTIGNSMNYASNWPLRGLKLTPFEGAVRVSGILWSKFLTSSNHSWDGYMHVVDWVPTLLSIAEATLPTSLDGINAWDRIVSNTDSRREEFFDIDDFYGYSAITSGYYKLVTGSVENSYSTYHGETLRGVIGNEPSYAKSIRDSKMNAVLNEIGYKFNVESTNVRNRTQINCGKETNSETTTCYPNAEGKMCLYNIKEDPCERKDLFDVHSDIAQRMLTRLQEELKRTVKKRRIAFRDPRSMPKLFNYTWSPWADDIDFPAS